MNMNARTRTIDLTGLRTRIERSRAAQVGAAAPKPAPTLLPEQAMMRERSQFAGADGVAQPAIPPARTRPASALRTSHRAQPVVVDGEVMPDPSIRIGEPAYHLNDLQVFHDAEFVVNAFYAVLRRAPYANEFRRRLDDLRGGMSKVELIGRLRMSPEGRQVGVRIDGLMLPLAVQLGYKVPAAGYLLRGGTALIGLPRILAQMGRTTAFVMARLRGIDRNLAELSHRQQVLAETQERLQGELETLPDVDARTQTLDFQIIALNEKLAVLETLEDKLRDEIVRNHDIQERLIGEGRGRLRSALLKSEQAVTRLTRQQGENAGALHYLKAQMVRLDLLESEIEALRGQFDAVTGALRGQIEAVTEALRSQFDAETGALRGQIEALVEATKPPPPPPSPPEPPPFPALHEVPGTRYMEELRETDPRLLDAPDWDTYYYAFEKLFYRSAAVVHQQRAYLPYLEPVDRSLKFLDLGCGRGEFMGLLKEQGIQTLGVDINSRNAERLREDGHEVVLGDALEFLKEAQQQFAGVALFQVIEHLSADYLRDLFKTAAEKLAPGGVLIAETLNPLSPIALNSFYMDETHVKPLPPEMVAFLMEWSGFTVERTLYTAPIPAEHRTADARANYYNYAIICRKP
jgi:SAM-dependent methyltransferase